MTCHQLDRETPHSELSEQWQKAEPWENLIAGLALLNRGGPAATALAEKPEIA